MKKIGFLTSMSDAIASVYLFISMIGFLWSLYLYTVQWLSLLHRGGVEVIIIAQLHSTKSELRFCAGFNPACGAMVRISGNGPGWK